MASDDLYSAAPSISPERVLSVSELTGQIKGTLEGHFPSVWVSGEISNFSRPQSGHCYLTLKDDKAQIARSCGGWPPAVCGSICTTDWKSSARAMLTSTLRVAAINS